MRLTFGLMGAWLLVLLVELLAALDLYLASVGPIGTCLAPVSLVVTLVVLVRTARHPLLFRQAWLRWLAYAGLLAVVASTLLSAGACGFALGLSFSLCLWCRFLTGPGIPRWLDLVLANFSLLLLLLEGATHLAGRLRPSPLFWDQDEVRPDFLKTRLASLPDSRFGKRVNGAGYFDDEFFPGGDKDWVACLVGDSFAYGVVPFDYNFATIAERKLVVSGRRAAIHNLGIPAIGPRQYGELMRTEVPRWNPHLVILSIYVGNDLRDIKVPQDWRNLTRWRFWVVMTRLLRWRKAAPADGRTAVGRDPGSDSDIPAYVHDWSQEPESMARSTYENIESGYLEVCRRVPAWESKHAFLLEVVSYFQRASRGHLLVLICPTAGQVDDSFYAALLAQKEHPEELQRDYPQQKIGEFCRRQGIACLDLLPALRAAWARRLHLYHRNDTHWNAAGNRVVGDVLGDYLNHSIVVTGRGSGERR
ncbi:MAG: hypothetical protein KF760_11015 [Candidatus Eremiobacteraeota bacterium]|nr:hypothetical protein [Candidatus Eremiobacteraeota bacterium]MCW5867263.1 hypothetical protein [Candidatus Eremiobacteraeota bacterium]